MTAIARPGEHVTSRVVLIDDVFGIVVVVVVAVAVVVVVDDESRPKRDSRFTPVVKENGNVSFVGKHDGIIGGMKPCPAIQEAAKTNSTSINYVRWFIYKKSNVSFFFFFFF